MEKINLAWWTGEGGKNFGDKLSPWLAKKISGKEINTISMSDTSDTIRYYGVGSILPANKHSIIWGSGFILKDSPVSNPIKICAVRGKLSRDKFISNQIECPEVYGDPALLLPLYYNQKVKIKHKIGILPHYIDKNENWTRDFQGALIIDIFDKIENVIDQVRSCEKLVTSSLHGLILAHAYGMPVCRVQGHNLCGGEFKFKDYYSGIGIDYKKPSQPGNYLFVSENLSNYDALKLLESCPFK